MEGGGRLKAKTRPSQGLLSATALTSLTQQGTPSSPYLTNPISLMSIEIHVQCRIGGTDSKRIAMTPSADRDRVVAVVYIFARDPGGGESLQVLERGCIFVPSERELLATSARAIGESVRSSLPTEVLGYASPIAVECVQDEQRLMLRLGSIVRRKDPDFLFSWDTQASGIGYLVERGASLGKEGTASLQNQSRHNAGIDMARLLGRTPTSSSTQFGTIGLFSNFEVAKSSSGGEQGGDKNDDNIWKGSRLGAAWDDRVGAGAAAASIVRRYAVLVLCCNFASFLRGKRFFLDWSIGSSSLEACGGRSQTSECVIPAGCCFFSSWQACALSRQYQTHGVVWPRQRARKVARHSPPICQGGHVPSIVRRPRYDRTSR